MKMLSATEAIGPTWEHTAKAFFRPMQWKRFFKFSGFVFLMQICAMLVMLPIFVVMAGIGIIGSAATGQIHSHAALAIVITSIVLLLTIALAVWVCRIWAKLYFVVFATVATGRFDYEDHWKHFTKPAWGWAGLFLLFIVPTVLLLLVVLGSFDVIMPHMQPANTAGAANSMLPFLAIMLMYSLMFVYEIVMYCGITLIIEFTPPFMFAGGQRAFAALGSAWRLILQNKGATALYLVMKFALTMAVTIVLEIIFLVGALVLAIPIGGIGIVLYSALHNHGEAATVVLVAAAILGGIVAFVCFMALVACIQSMLLYLLLSYAYYFLGGRYQPLGDLLEPPPLVDPLPLPAQS